MISRLMPGRRIGSRQPRAQPPQRPRRRPAWLGLAAAAVGVGVLCLAFLPESLMAGNPLPPAPKPPELGNFVQDEAAAVQLGKALFWDTQAGGYGRTACATCHFKAGVDARVRNTINPKGDGFQIAGPDGTVTAADFPFHRLANPDDTHSAVLFDTNDVVGAQGGAAATFID